MVLTPSYLKGEIVERSSVVEENEKLEAIGKIPAVYEQILLGITKGSLVTESFISAASFQETTRVLTEAAVRGSSDQLAWIEGKRHRGSLDPGRHRTRLPRRSSPTPDRGTGRSLPHRGRAGAEAEAEKAAAAEAEDAEAPADSVGQTESQAQQDA